MNYQKIYENLVNNAKSQNRVKLKKDNPDYVYYEKHHIHPKSLGGVDDSVNLVLLTAKEHFIAHKLLTFIYPKSKEMALAFWYMTIGNKKQEERYRTKLSSRDYKYARELACFANSGKNNSMYGKTLSEETKQIIRKSQKGRKRSTEFKKKVSEGMKGINLGKNLSNDHKKKLSKAKLGDLNPNKNGLSKDHIDKISKSNLRLKRSEETKRKISESKKGKIPWNKGNKNNYRGKIKKDPIS